MGNLGEDLRDILVAVFYKGASAGLDFPKVAKPEKEYLEVKLSNVEEAFIDAGWMPKGDERAYPSQIPVNNAESFVLHDVETVTEKEWEAKLSDDDLCKKLDEAIMETIWINKIDKSDQRKVHPKWFVANGQMFTFGVDVERIKTVLKDVVRSGNAYGEFDGHQMTAQEWLSKTLHAFYDHAQEGDYFRNDKQFKASTVTMAEVEKLLKKAAGIE